MGKRLRRAPAWGVGASLLGLVGLLVLPVAPAVASTVLVFQEPHKGTTETWVDVAPKSPKKIQGIPTQFSPGDKLKFIGPLKVKGRVVGKISGTCIAAHNGSIRNLPRAEFTCTAHLKIPGGSLVLVGPPDAGNGSKPATEGKVVSGTGQYAGSRGTFSVEEGWTADTNTITLLE